MWSTFEIEVCQSVIPHPYEAICLGELELARPTPCYACIVEGSHGYRLRQVLRRVTPRSGLYPLLIPFDIQYWDMPWFDDATGRFVRETHPVNPDSIEAFWQTFQSELPEQLPQLASEALNTAMRVDVDPVFQALATRQSTQWGNEYEALLLASSTESISPFAWHLQRQNEPYVAIVLLPICEPWQAVLFATTPRANREHGWAEIGHPAFSPSDDRSFQRAQMSFDLMVSKYWWDTYRADIAFADFSTLSWVASRPPRTIEAAFQLAQEQYLYCNDAIQQQWLCENGQTIAPQSIAHLAQLLRISDRWSLWWD